MEIIKQARIGFFGELAGMTDTQAIMLGEFLFEITATADSAGTEVIAHVGDERGGDEQFHKILENSSPKCNIILHPILNSKTRAHIKCSNTHNIRTTSLIPCDVDTVVKNIIKNTDLIIACPATYFKSVMQNHSWDACQYAMKQGKAVLFVFPDAKVEVHEPSALNAKSSIQIFKNAKKK
jgi:hypothetical protein